MTINTFRPSGYTFPRSPPPPAARRRESLHLPSIDVCDARLVAPREGCQAASVPRGAMRLNAALYNVATPLL